jgi:thioredoxin 1
MVKKINEEQFGSEAKKSAVAVVDFSATWCAGQVDFYNVDVDDAPELASAYRVQSIPCLVMMKQGELVDQAIGFRPQAQLSQWIKENL